jgi:hypothetical protein
MDSSKEIPEIPGLTKLEKANIIAPIKMEYVNGLLTIDTISAISEAVIKFAVPDYYKLTQNERRSESSKLLFND